MFVSKRKFEAVKAENLQLHAQLNDAKNPQHILALIAIAQARIEAFENLQSHAFVTPDIYAKYVGTKVELVKLQFRLDNIDTVNTHNANAS